MWLAKFPQTRLCRLVDKGATATALEGVAARALAVSTVSFIVDLLSKVDGTVLHARNLALDVVCSVKKAMEVEAEQDECAARGFRMHAISRGG